MQLVATAPVYVNIFIKSNTWWHHSTSSQQYPCILYITHLVASLYIQPTISVYTVYHTLGGITLHPANNIRVYCISHTWWHHSTSSQQYPCILYIKHLVASLYIQPTISVYTVYQTLGGITLHPANNIRVYCISHTWWHHSTSSQQYPCILYITHLVASLYLQPTISVYTVYHTLGGITLHPANNIRVYCISHTWWHHSTSSQQYPCILYITHLVASLYIQPTISVYTVYHTLGGITLHPANNIRVYCISNTWWHHSTSSQQYPCILYIKHLVASLYLQPTISVYTVYHTLGGITLHPANNIRVYCISHTWWHHSTSSQQYPCILYIKHLVASLYIQPTISVYTVYQTLGGITLHPANNIRVYCISHTWWHHSTSSQQYPCILYITHLVASLYIQPTISVYTVYHTLGGITLHPANNIRVYCISHTWWHHSTSSQQYPCILYIKHLVASLYIQPTISVYTVYQTLGGITLHPANNIRVYCISHTWWHHSTSSQQYPCILYITHLVASLYIQPTISVYTVYHTLGGITLHPANNIRVYCISNTWWHHSTSSQQYPCILYIKHLVASLYLQPTISVYTVYHTLGGITLHPANNIRDLGVYIPDDMSWTLHIATKPERWLHGYSVFFLLAALTSKILDIQNLDSIQRTFTSKITGPPLLGKVGKTLTVIVTKNHIDTYQFTCGKSVMVSHLTT